MLQLGGQLGAEFGALGWQFALVERVHMREVVRNLAGLEPLVKSILKMRVSKILAPDGREWLAGFNERAVKIEQPHQPRPLARPVCGSKNWTAVTAQPRQNVMAILPGRCGKHQLRLGMNLHEDVHALPLRRNETVLHLVVVSVSADQLVALLREGRGELFFHVALRGPALLVGRLAQIAAGDEQHFIGGWLRLFLTVLPHFLPSP